MATVSLVWLAKTPEGWQRFPVTMGRNGRVRRGVAVIDGREIQYPAGDFQLRYYENRQTKYKSVGTDPLEAVKERDRMLHFHDAKESAIAAGVTVTDPREDRPTIDKEQKRWVNAARNRGAETAADSNEFALTEFLEANPKIQYLDEITPDTLTIYRRWMIKNGNAERTVKNKLERVVSLLKFCKVAYKDWPGFRLPKIQKKLPTVYTEAEVARLVSEAKIGARSIGFGVHPDYNLMMIELLRTTGMREKELMYLCWNDVNLAEKHLRVQEKPEFPKFKVKNHEQRDLPITDKVVRMLKEWYKITGKGSLVLPTSKAGPNSKMLRALKHVAKRANVKNATLHKFRRTYATNLLRGKMDLRTVMMLMGHKDVESTMCYLTPATGETVRNMVNDIL